MTRLKPIFLNHRAAAAILLAQWTIASAVVWGAVICECASGGIVVITTGDDCCAPPAEDQTPATACCGEVDGHGETPCIDRPAQLNARPGANSTEITGPAPNPSKSWSNPGHANQRNPHPPTNTPATILPSLTGTVLRC